MMIDLSIRRHEREAERRQCDAALCARLLADAAGVYALADEEQQGELAFAMEEALGMLLDLRREAVFETRPGTCHRRTR